ncbi:thiamine diphosphokinase [Tepidibacillus fermentans]|uniref:Thiamine diphosphokinase n=1 Tax=Tepidibacillus fermentans TaxID=1281767 RepID=A0A4R3KMV3_9BACI|nr:thiamine diphosphokinase [Tepidibacillus fermentans]TCS84348.1 thiamine pyrophosphokinase [Tepidibacillus fermentans]
MEKKDIFIVSGGILTERLVSMIKEDDLIIGVDRGAEWIIQHGRIPHYIIGDFDSANSSFLETIKEQYGDKVQIFPSEKDETDTELAIRFAISLLPTSITIIGAIGTRLDHVLANIHVLLQAERQQIPSQIFGTNNRIRIVLPNKTLLVQKGEYKYTSLIPFTEKVEGISIKGFKYPLSHATMEVGFPYGISNELISEQGTISIEKGILLVIESRD